MNFQQRNSRSSTQHCNISGKMKGKLFVMYSKSQDRMLIIIEQSIKEKLENSYDKISVLSGQINDKFKSGKFKSDQQFKVKKFQKDFGKNFAVYIKLLSKRNQSKEEQITALKQSSQTYRQSLLEKPNGQKGRKGPSADDSDYEDDYHSKQIELQQVNQQTLFYQHMIELKQKELMQVKKKMEDALNVQKQVGRLVNQQGQKLDLAQTNIDNTRANVKDAQQLLAQAKKNHISANKKKFCIAGIIFVILLIIVVPIIVTQAS